MKKIVLALSAVLLGATALAPTATAMPGAYASVDQFAEADWIVMHGDEKATLYFGMGWRMASPDGVRTLGAVGKGKCRVEKTRHITMIVCQVSGRAKPLAMNELQIDPALRSATLRMKQDGRVNKVTWDGRGELPWTGGQVVAGDDLVAAGAGMERDARAAARIFGRKVSSRNTWISFAFLGQGGVAAAFTGYGRSVTLDDDGFFTYRVEVRIPR